MIMTADYHVVESNQKGAFGYAPNYNGKATGGHDSGPESTAASSSHYRRRSSLNHGSSRCFKSVQFSSILIVIVANLLLLSGFWYGHSFNGWFSSRVSSAAPAFHAEHGKGRSMLSKAASSNPNCTKVYSAGDGETCATLRASQGLSQPQIFEINPGLNCKSLSKGQAVCVQGISAHCGRAIYVTKGPTNTTCASIEADGKLSGQGLRILNPGISCPEDAGNNNSWPSSHPVCVFPGLGNLFFEYLGASGLPITFADVSPLVQKYPSVVFNFILAFAIDVDANGTRTNGTFYPYWSPELTPAAAKAFKAANPNVRILVSLGGASKYVNETLTLNVTWKDPANTAKWIDIAQASLTSIVNEYSADGIDIDYENFPSGSSAFTLCMGTLIERLKGNNTIGLATIAPFGNVNPEYVNLINRFGEQVDYVNIQFYAYQLHTVQRYVAQFNESAYQFPPWKVTASTKIGGNNSITGSLFLQAVDEIQKSRGLAGVMFYDADDSDPHNFTEENSIAAILNTGLTTSSTPLTVAPVPSPLFGPSPVPSLAPAPTPRSGSVPTPVPSSQAPHPGGLAPFHAPGSSRAPAPTTGAPRSGLAPAPASKSSLGPALTPGAPHSSLAPARTPGAPESRLVPAPAPTPGAPQSSLSPGPAPKSSSAPTPTPGAPKSGLGPAPAPKSSSAPTPTPGAPKSGLGPAPAPKSSSAPASTPGAPKSGPAPPLSPPGSTGTPGSNPGGEAPSPSGNSAPSRLLRSRWPSQGFGLLATVFVLLFPL